VKSKLNNIKTLLYRLGKDPDKKKKSYRKKQNTNLGQIWTAIEKVVAGVTNNGKEGPEGGSSNGDSTAATLSPKNEPHAGVEKVCFTYP